MAESEADSISTSPIGDLPDRSSHNDAETLPSLKLEYYDMSKAKKMIIFNHYDYDKNYPGLREKPPIRHGTNYDVEALENTFRALDFDVTTHHDKKSEEILAILGALCEAKQDHRATSCVCVYVLTHGWNDGWVCARDQMYNLNGLITMLQDTAGLVGKPKLVVVQACRGERMDSGRRVDGPGGGQRLPTHADTLVLTSSVEDFRSFRSCYGSWLIQEWCRVVKGRGDLDVLQMATLVTSLVAREYVSNTLDPNTDNKKQTPEVRSTLTKLLRLSHNSHSTG